jgi:hypothetical protein
MARILVVGLSPVFAQETTRLPGALSSNDARATWCMLSGRVEGIIWNAQFWRDTVGLGYH